MKRSIGSFCTVLTLTCLTVACSSNDNHAYVRPTGRGSTACQAWQKAFCDLAAVECASTTEEKCVDTYYSITCNSDEKAQACATALDNSTCATGLPANCNVTDLADPAPAIAACNALVDALCQKESDCGASTVDTCKTQIGSTLNCSTAIGYTPGYDTCISDLSKLACSAANLPSSCTDVIKTSS